jgi:hypothetical protein
MTASSRCPRTLGVCTTTIAAMFPLLLAACATTGATFGSGVGDAHLERPPYYTGARVAAEAKPIGHFPVAYQRGATQAPIFDPTGGDNSPVASLVAEMNAYLDSLGVTTALVRRGATTRPRGTPPDVIFGCETDHAGDCLTPGAVTEGAFQRSGDDPTMRLAVGRPSAEWIADTRTALDGAGAGRALVLTLEVAPYRITRTGWRNSKSVALGTNYSVKLPWLTSIDNPVLVLQLTGALVQSDGRAVRIGAEGLLARRTGIVAGGAGLQALVTDEDVAQLRQSRREDLPGQPLVWQVALRNLIAQLTGREEIASR